MACQAGFGQCTSTTGASRCRTDALQRAAARGRFASLRCASSNQPATASSNLHATTASATTTTSATTTAAATTSATTSAAAAPSHVRSSAFKLCAIAGPDGTGTSRVVPYNASWTRHAASEAVWLAARRAAWAGNGVP